MRRGSESFFVRVTVAETLYGLPNINICTMVFYRLLLPPLQLRRKKTAFSSVMIALFAERAHWFLPVDTLALLAAMTHGHVHTYPRSRMAEQISHKADFLSSTFWRTHGSLELRRVVGVLGEVDD